MDEMPPALALASQAGSSLCDSAVEGACRKRSAETDDLPSNPMPASGSGSAADVEQTEVMAPVAAALEEDGDDLEVRTIPGSDEEDPSSIEPEMSAGSSSSVVSDSSNLSCAIDEFSISDSSGEMGTPSSMDAGTVRGNAVPGPASWELGVNPLAVSMNVATPSVIELGNPESSPSGDGSHSRSLFLMERLPLWGFITICGRRPEMEDAVVVVPHFFEVPLCMLIGDQSMDGLDPDVIRIPLHFFGVYDGHGGAQVANYCRERLHLVLMEQLENLAKHLGGTSRSDWKKHWENAFVDCFRKVDDQVGGKESRGNMGSTAEAQNEGDMLCPNVLIEAVAPETVGSTAVVAVVCSAHIIIANCGDSRAVLCRGKQPLPLSVDHKPNREDEYARIEAQGGKVIQWNGYRATFDLPYGLDACVPRKVTSLGKGSYLAYKLKLPLLNTDVRLLELLIFTTTQPIAGDRYLKPWIIPEPEVTIVPRAREDECLILASDGLWDVMSNEEVCDVARRRILLWHKKNGPVSAATQRGEGNDPAAQAAAECLSRLAVQKGSKDNITIIVVNLLSLLTIDNKVAGFSLVCWFPTSKWKNSKSARVQQGFPDSKR
ncbi:phosphatase 2C [Musa troglodytarum]|uniref:protein-serine/threonine phosphatase n=1 Tax=Musa troglodytarum TaxID=320322 RepID=A0A9E7HV66_9LILI|nr:phosphatase 2C [Musa troglodytarum]